MAPSTFQSSFEAWRTSAACHTHRAVPTAAHEVVVGVAGIEAYAPVAAFAKIWRSLWRSDSSDL